MSRVDYFMEFSGKSGKWYRANWTLWGVDPPSLTEIAVIPYIRNEFQARKRYIEMITQFAPFNVRLSRRTVTETETVEVIA